MSAPPFASLPASSVAALAPGDASRLADQLRAMGAVLFTQAADEHSARALADLAPLVASGAVLHVACDAGPGEAAACTRAGVAITPTLAAGGERAEGYASLRSYLALADAPAPVAAALAARGARVYGRDGCVWTRRQKAVLGVGAAALYVDCDSAAGAPACEAAGVDAVPAWKLPGRALAPGYRPLGALREWLA